MKKLFSLSFFAALVLGWASSFAQCNIVTPNTTPGFTPVSPPSVTQGVAYSQTLQVYVPTSYSPATIDSVHISSMSGLPAGITYVFNPASGTVIGGGNGAICFSGTTASPAGKYPITFHGTAYVKIAGSPTTFQLDQAPLNTTFVDTFTVIAQQVLGCDTLSNVDLNTDTAVFYQWQSPNVGYVSGNGALSQGGQFFHQTGVAERFNSLPGNHVNTAYVFAAYTAINPADSGLPVTIYVYDTTGVPALGLAGAPGNPIDSAVVALSQFASSATNGNPVKTNFPHQPALTGTGGFYIVVNLPQVTGDTIVLLTNTGDTYTGNGWLNTDAGWIGLDSLVGGIKNIGNFIVAVACPSQNLPPIAAYTSDVTSGCAPTTVNFTDASTQSPINYYWNFGDGTTATTANAAHTYATAGSYAVIHIVQNVNGQTESVGTITVNAAPTGSASVSAGAATVIATGAAPFTYLWSNGSTTDSISNVATGVYSVVITDNNGCQDTVRNISVQGVGILELSTGRVSVYPNPATDVLNLVWSQQSNAEVSVLDLNGQLISTVITNGDMKTVYDIRNLAAGTYIIRVTDKGNNKQQSLLFSKF